MPTHHIPSTPANVHWGFWDAARKPLLTIRSGDTVTIDTVSGQPDTIPDENAGFEFLPDLKAVLAETPKGPGPHLLTGPVAIEGAEPGDSLKIEIKDIRLRQTWGFTVIKPLVGTLPEDFPDFHLLHPRIDLDKQTIRMPWGLEIAAAPFFGCLGTAPPADWGMQTSIIPRAFGGNMDCKDLVAGTTLYLPVFHAGGLFSVGDGHGVQGHGEVCVTAVETALTGTFRITLEKNTGLNAPLAAPWAETPEHIVTFGFDEDLDDAAKHALRDMIRRVSRATGLSAADAYCLCSLVCDLHVTQLVNIHKGVHAMLPKWALGKGK